MIDPHGEYSAAFRNTGHDLRRRQPADAVLADELRGALRGVPDLAPATTAQEDADILAKCLLKARGKNRLAETLGKITVDSPIPYLLSAT